MQDFIQNKEAFKLSSNEEDESAPELEMKCDYAVDAMRMLTERKGIIKQEMFNDALMVRQVQKFIEQLVKPFPFLQVVAEQVKQRRSEVTSGNSTDEGDKKKLEHKFAA